MKSEATTLLEPRPATPPEAGPRAAARPRRSFLARQVLARLEQLSVGTLALEHAGERLVFGTPAPEAPDAAIAVHDERFWSAVATRGSVGAGEGFAKGWWTSASPTDVVRLFVRNQGALEGLDSGLARLSRPLLKAYHALRRNTESQSRANIAAHYDLSNDFFRLFLDETLTYSCGIFEREDATLREASVAKIDRLCRKLELKPTDHLLEIGTGWGAFAIHAAREHGCRVTTTTISKEQHALAQERIRAAGLEDRITLLFEDYRRLEGTFDKLVSVEMIEAVGAKYFDSFFAQCGRLLKPDGLMALQAITIADQHYESALRRVDYIKRHVFPGSFIPSVTAITAAATKHTDLRLTKMEDFGLHYAETLARWRGTWQAGAAAVRELGGDDRLLRAWSFYFAYCEAGFRERHIGVCHLRFERPGFEQGGAAR